MPRGRNDYETAQIQGRLWTPAVLRPAAWFDASDLSTIKIATGVSQWNDRGPNANNATQSTGTQQPVYSEFAAEGYPSIYGDGSDDLMNVPITGMTSFPISMFVALRRRLASPKGAWVKVGKGSAPGDGLGLGIGGSQFDNTGTNLIALKERVAWVLTGQTVATRSIACFGPGSTTSTTFIRQNGSNVTITNGLTDTAIAPSTEAFIVGYPELSRYSSDYLHEIIVLNDEYSVSKFAAVEGYLSWKWGIPLAADHPFANRPPLIGD